MSKDISFFTSSVTLATSIFTLESAKRAVDCFKHKNESRNLDWLNIYKQCFTFKQLLNCFFIRKLILRLKLLLVNIKSQKGVRYSLCFYNYLSPCCIRYGLFCLWRHKKNIHNQMIQVCKQDSISCERMTFLPLFAVLSTLSIRKCKSPPRHNM